MKNYRIFTSVIAYFFYASLYSQTNFVFKPLELKDGLLLVVLCALIAVYKIVQALLTKQ